MLNPQPLQRRLQFAGSFLILALLIEALTVLWTRPVAFVVFVGLSGVLFAGGIILYLYSLVRFKGASSKQ
jgi:hypothetical protein